LATAPVFSDAGRTKPARQATYPTREERPFRTNGATTVGNRRGSDPVGLQGSTEPCCTAKGSDGLIVRSSVARAMAETAGHQFFKSVARMQRAEQALCDFFHVTV